jgi:hypothetical protein
MNTIQVRELLYEVTLKITGMTEYGVSFEALIAEKWRHRLKVPDSISRSREQQAGRS